MFEKIASIGIFCTILGLSIYIWGLVHTQPRVTQEDAIVLCTASALRGDTTMDACMSRFGYTR